MSETLFPVPGFDAQHLSLEELRGCDLDAEKMISALADGRDVVRANAALALAVLRHPSTQLVVALKDAAPAVSENAAFALSQLEGEDAQLLVEASSLMPSLGESARTNLRAGLVALGTQTPDVLLECLRVPSNVAVEGLLKVFTDLGESGATLLAKAARSGSAQIRMNAVTGLGFMVEAGFGVDEEVLESATDDSVQGVRESAAALLLVLRSAPKPLAFKPSLPLPFEGFDGEIFSVEVLESQRDSLNPKHLSDLLRDGREIVRANAVRGLGILGESPASIGGLLLDSEEEVRRAAADTLHILGAESGVLLLSSLPKLKDAAPPIRTHVIKELVRIGRETPDVLMEGLRLPANEASGIIEIFVQLEEVGLRTLHAATKDDSALIRTNAITALSRLNEEGVEIHIEEIEPLIHDPIQLVSETAARMVDIYQARRRTSTLVHGPLPSEDFHKAILSFDQLRGFQESLSADRLSAALKEGRTLVRANAARAMAVLDVADPQLALLVQDPEAEVRIAATDALLALGPNAALLLPRTLPGLIKAEEETRTRLFDATAALVEAHPGLLIEALRVPPAEAEITILEVFDRLGEKGAPLLSEAISSDSALIRINAIVGMQRLTNLGVGVDLPSVQAALKDPVTPVKTTAEEILAHLSRPKPPSISPPRPLPFDGFDAELLSLSELRANKAKLDVAALEGLLQDGRELVRANAAAAMGVLKHPSELLSLALRDAAPRVREAATEAIGQIGSEAGSLLIRLAPTLPNLSGEIRDHLISQMAALSGRADATLLELFRIPTEVFSSSALLVIDVLGVDAQPLLNLGAKDDSALIRANTIHAATHLLEKGLSIKVEALSPLTEDKVRFIADAARDLFEARERANKRASFKPMLPVPTPAFEARLLEAEDLAPLEASLDDGFLVSAFQDGRAVVRANAATAAGALGRPLSELPLLLRDSAFEVRRSAAQALLALGKAAHHLLPRTIPGIVGSEEEVKAPVIEALTQLLGASEALLIESLRHPHDLAASTVLVAFDRLGQEGVPVLHRALEDSSGLIRINAAAGLDRAVNAGCGIDIEAIERATRDHLDAVREVAVGLLAQVSRPAKPALTEPVELPIPAFSEKRLDAKALVKVRESLNANALRRLLRDGRPFVRANAALSLAILERADAGLAMALQDSSAMVREAAAEALGILGPKAVGHLPRILPKLIGASPRLKEHLLAQLAPLAQRAPEILIEALRVDSDVAEATVLDVFSKLGEQAAPILQEALKNDSALIRSNAILGMGRLMRAGLPFDLQGLQLALNDKVSLVAQTAADLLDQREREERRVKVLESKPLPLKDFDLRILDLEELEEYKKKLELPRILAALDDGRHLVRANAVRSLIILKHPTPRLALLLRDAYAEVRDAAALALRHLGRAATPFLIKGLPALEGADAALKAPVYEALAELAGVSDDTLVEGLRLPFRTANATILEVFELLGAAGIPILLKATRNDSAMIRVNAISALENLIQNGYGFKLEPIEERLLDPVSHVRQCAARIIQHISFQDRQRPKTLPGVSLPFPEFEHEAQTIESLEARKDELALEEMLKLMGDGRVMVRTNAARSMAALGHATGRLLLLLRDSDLGVRQGAAEALLHLGTEAKHLVGRAVATIQGSGRIVQRLLLKALHDVSEAIPGVLIEALRMPPGLAEQTVLQVCDQLGARAVSTFEEALRNESALIRINAARGLRRLVRAGHPVNFDVMEIVKGDPVEVVRTMGQLIDRDLNSRRKPPALTEGKALPHPDFSHSRLSAAALKKVKKSLELEHLKELLNDGREMVRVNALIALGVLKEVPPRVVVSLRDGSPKVKEEAAKLLEQHATKEPHLVAKSVFALFDAEPLVKEQLLSAFKKLVGKEEALLIETLRMPLPMAESTILQVFDVLGEDAVRLLREALKSDSMLVRLNGARGLERLALCGEEIPEELLNQASEDPIDEVRRAVIRIYAALNTEPRNAPVEPIPRPHIEFDTRCLSDDELKGCVAALSPDQLSELLSNGLEEVRANAARSLAFTGRPSHATLQQLLVLLRDEGPRVRQNAAFALLHSGAPAEHTLPRVLRALRGADEVMTALLLEIVEGYGDDAIPVLLSALDQPAKDVLESVAKVVRNRKDRLLEPLLEILKAPRAIERQRINAANLLESTLPRHPAVRAEVRAFRNRHRKRSQIEINPKKSRRAKAVEPEPFPVEAFETVEISTEDFERCKSSLELPRLVRALQDGRALVRLNALNAILTLGADAERATDQVAVRLRDPDPLVQIAASRVVALTKAFPKLVIPTLASVYLESAPFVQAAFDDTLRAYGEEGASEVLKVMAKNPLRLLRTMRKVVHLHPEFYADNLSPFLLHPRLKTREVAIELLFELGEHAKAQRPKLLEALKQKDGSVRRFAIQALGQLPADKETITELQRLKKTDFSNSIQYSLRHALTKLTGEVVED